MCEETTWFGNCHSYSNAVVFDGMLLKPDIKKLLQL